MGKESEKEWIHTHTHTYIWIFLLYTWVWVNSRSWWWTGRPGVLQFMGSQRVGHDWVTELNWKKINPDYSLQGLLLKMKLQHFGHLIQSANSSEKTLMLGKIEGKKRRQRMRWLDSITDSNKMNLWKLWEIWRTGEPGMLQSTKSFHSRKELDMT